MGGARVESDKGVPEEDIINGEAGVGGRDGGVDAVDDELGMDLENLSLSHALSIDTTFHIHVVLGID